MSVVACHHNVQVPTLPLARVSQRDPAACNVPPPRPATAGYKVTDICDQLAINKKDFQQLHRVGIQEHLLRTVRDMEKVGPGAYHPETAEGLVRRVSPRYTEPKSARLRTVQKTKEELEQDERRSLRKNMLALRTLFAAALPDDEVDGRSPRWLQPTECMSARRKVTQQLADSVAAEKQKRMALPMTFSLFQHASVDAEVHAPAATSNMPAGAAATDDTNNDGTTTKQQQQLQSRQRKYDHPAGAESGPPSYLSIAAATAPPTTPKPPPTSPRSAFAISASITAEQRLTSIRKALSRPSSASTRTSVHDAHGGSGHWLAGTVQRSSLLGVCVANPRDGKTDSFYDVERSSSATKVAAPQVSMGTSPRFVGDQKIAKPPSRPASARVDRFTAAVSALGAGGA